MAKAETFDVVVIGSGGGGLCAALAASAAGKSVAVLEKQALVGGSTSMSGGVIWVPDSSLQRAAGAKDSLEDALAYMRSFADYDGPATSPARQEAFVRGGSAMIDFLLAEGLDLEYIDGWADYFGHGHQRGRLVASKLYDTRPLGEWAGKLALGPFSLPLSSPEGVDAPLAKRTFKGLRAAMKMMARFKVDAWRGYRRFGLGTGIIAQMLAAVLRHKVTIRLETPVTELVVRNGRVSGVVTGSGETVMARNGVVIAAGGFAKNQELRERYLPQPTKVEWSVANAGDTGDLIAPVLALGAATELLDAAVWAPATIPPDGHPQFANGNINKPGSILVASDGKRFVNESNSYHDIVRRMYTHPGAAPCWEILDSRHLARYPFGARAPGKVPREWIDSGYFIEGGSIAELAEKCGIDRAGLTETVARMNAFARTGKDADFGRGDLAYDRYYGDPTVKPNPCLAPIDQAPFYAVRVYPSEGGVMGGFSTDGEARVLKADGKPIPGLYATGTAAASVFGYGYPCSGGALAVSFTWGFIAGQALGRA